MQAIALERASSRGQASNWPTALSALYGSIDAMPNMKLTQKKSIVLVNEMVSFVRPHTITCYCMYFFDQTN